MLASDIKKRIEELRIKNESEAQAWISLPAEDRDEEEIRAGALKAVTLMYERCSSIGVFTFSRNPSPVIINICVVKLQHLGYVLKVSSTESGYSITLELPK